MEKIYGLHPVMAALDAGKRSIERIYLSNDKSGASQQLIQQAKSKKIPLKECSRQEMEKLIPQVKHQGVMAIASPLPVLPLDDMLTRVWEQNEEPFLIFVDSVQDPHNLGAIIRSAEGAGAHGLILSRHQTVGLTPTVAKSSAGALEYLPISIVNSPADCLRRLKEECRLWLVGLHPSGEKRYDQLDLRLPVTIIIGGEGVGLRPAMRKHCDWLACLPQLGKINSLNTSVAAALMLYEVRRQRA